MTSTHSTEPRVIAVVCGRCTAVHTREPRRCRCGLEPRVYPERFTAVLDRAPQ